MKKFHKIKGIKDKYDLEQQIRKFNEECYELMVALHDEDEVNIEEEFCDVVQVLIDLADRKGIDWEDAIYNHNVKLTSRGWDLI